MAGPGMSVTSDFPFVGTSYSNGIVLLDLSAAAGSGVISDGNKEPGSRFYWHV